MYVTAVALRNRFLSATESRTLTFRYRRYGRPTLAIAKCLVKSLENRATNMRPTTATRRRPTPVARTGRRRVRVVRPLSARLLAWSGRQHDGDALQRRDDESA